MPLPQIAPSASNPGATSPAAATGGDDPPFRYTAKLADQIEGRQRSYWDQHKTFATPSPGEPGFDGSREKFYVLDMFPYPSGARPARRSPEGYTATDIVSRHARMKGKNVLHPMGWDAFGLPANSTRSRRASTRRSRRARRSTTSGATQAVRFLVRLVA